MNNKRLGMAFEKEMAQRLADAGFWVHFLQPAPDGSQPFDLIFVKNGVAMVADCKTCASHIFGIDRLEDNQIMAFEKWIKCGNLMPLIFVKHNGVVYNIWYRDLKEQKRIDLLKLGDADEVHSGK